MSKSEDLPNKQSAHADLSRDAWIDLIQKSIVKGESEALREASRSLEVYPADPELLLTAALAALREDRPDQCLSYLNRFEKRYCPDVAFHLFRAMAVAQKGNRHMAEHIIRRNGLIPICFGSAIPYLPFTRPLMPWIRSWAYNLVEGNRENETEQNKKAKKAADRLKSKAKASKKASSATAAPVAVQPDDDADIPALPRLSAHIPISFNFPKAEDLLSSRQQIDNDDLRFRLRYDFAHLGLMQEFDELICLPMLHNVNIYWHQVETVRKVLKQFRGRVLLADEVGLGKTIEAGMALKEYILRGMVQRVLILTPASLVGQWLEEMESKFDLKFASTYDSLLRADPAAFWAQPKVIASIAAARRAEHFEILAAQTYDIVIADEAHHLKSRTTSNWKLVDALRKRFLLLLSATPVQNSLVELYNLLTLLKPGIFKTEKEFRSNYMVSGKPRMPANREKLRDLMRDVMIRNTRSLVDARLPSRHAVTMRIEAGSEEIGCYRELSRLTQELHKKGSSKNRLALRHLLSAAGSSPGAAAAAVERFTAKGGEHGEDWGELHRRYQALARGCKEKALFDLLKRNPEEKKMIFVRHRETIEHIDALLRKEGTAFARFDGSMSGPDKDAAIGRFRDEAPILLCSESGGEGRNLQFCNTMINFDLPWNPMAIEQRIGRLHRIGQTRQVFVFNLAVRNTLEEHILRILDEKINMFELVVGEIDAILGEMDDDMDFAETVFNMWVETTEENRASVFDALGDRIIEAKRQYEAVKVLDEELFGEDFETS